MNLIDPAVDQFRIFFLVLIRCSVIIFFLPFFGSRNWPTLTKVGFVLLLSLILFPKARGQGWALPDTVLDYGLVVLLEALVALCLGLAIDLVLAGIQLGGQLVGFQLGFSIVNVLDPQSGAQVSLVGQFLYLVVLLLFLTLNGHHLFIYALAESLDKIRPAQVSLNQALFNQIMHLTLTMFSLAVKLVAPAVAVLLFSQAVMGVVAKAVPQMNVMIVSFPLNIGVGLFFLGVSLAFIGQWMGGYVGRELGVQLHHLIRALGGG